MTADDKTLTDEIARALATEEGYELPWEQERHAGLYRERAVAVLPIIRKAERDATREALDGLITDTAIDVRLGTEGNDPQRVQDAEAVMDAAQIYRDTEYPEETP